MSNKHDIEQVYQRIHEIAIKGKMYVRDFYRLINEYINKSQTQLFMDTLETKYQIQSKNANDLVENKKGIFNEILFQTTANELVLIDEIMSNKDVYAIGNEIYKVGNFNEPDILLGTFKEEYMSISTQSKTIEIDYTTDDTVDIDGETAYVIPEVPEDSLIPDDDFDYNDFVKFEESDSFDITDISDITFNKNEVVICKKRNISKEDAKPEIEDDDIIISDNILGTIRLKFTSEELKKYIYYRLLSKEYYKIGDTEKIDKRDQKIDIFDAKKQIIIRTYYNDNISTINKDDNFLFFKYNDNSGVYNILLEFKYPTGVIDDIYTYINKPEKTIPKTKNSYATLTQTVVTDLDYNNYQIDKQYLTAAGYLMKYLIVEKISTKEVKKFNDIKTSIYTKYDDAINFLLS